MSLLVRRPLRATAALALAATALLAGCSSSDDGDGDGGGSPPEAAPSPTQAADPPPGPEDGRCYRLRYAQAVSPTHSGRDRDCSRPHTAETYATGELDTVVGGHLLAVDSEEAQQQVATECPEQLSGFVGGDLAALRLSMLQPVWFTPSLRQSDQGATWYRCDVIALEGPEQLREVTGSLEGVLADDAGRAEYAMCGTAAPDDADFERVGCGSEHSWRAVSVVTFEAVEYPGEEAARERGQVPCEDAGAAAAADPLDFEWSYEFPTEEQWDAGMTFGRCWVPD